jgi:hypothetical protein
MIAILHLVIADTLYPNEESGAAPYTDRPDSEDVFRDDMPRNETPAEKSSYDDRRMDWWR